MHERLSGKWHLACLIFLAAGAVAVPLAASDEPPQGENEKSAAGFETPTPKSAGERQTDRDRMVERQIARPVDGREAITNADVLNAMRAVPRHAFVPEVNRHLAYSDSPLPIGHGQTISQPYIVALMTELLELTPKSRVLEIGTGSGYQAAVLAQLTPHVYTIEIVEPLHKEASRVLREQGYDSIKTRFADGYHGWPEEAPFDRIIVTCAAGHLPPPLWDQLKPGGWIVIPIGGPKELQRLVVMTRNEDGTRESRTVTAVRFVPLTRGDQK